MTEREQEQHDFEVVKEAADTLAKHFPSVQIFVHRPKISDEEDASLATAISAGRGDWYARYGQVNEWMLQVEAGIKSKHYII